MPQNPFLMKVLLKKEVCGSHEQCMGPTKKALKQKKKKKKKKQNKTKQNKTKQNTNAELLLFSSIQTDTYSYIEQLTQFCNCTL